MQYHDVVRNHHADDFNGKNDYDLGSHFFRFHLLPEFHLLPLNILFSQQEFNALYELDVAFA
jgi:hypothetical protein